MAYQRKYTNRRYLDALAKRVLVFDGAMGTNIAAQNLEAAHYGGEKLAGCNDHLVLSYPVAVEKVHRMFLEAGADVLETDTFRANRLTLGEFGIADKVQALNMAAAKLARQTADEFSTIDKPRFVAGSIGPSGKLPSSTDPDLSNMDFAELASLFKEQAEALLLGGVDLLLIETSQDILEVKAAVAGLWQAFEATQIYVPIQAQVTLDTSGRMLLGTDISAVVAILEGLAIDVLGINCSTGPDYMRESIQYLSEHCRLPISCIPNAGLPLNVDGEAVYPMQPDEFAHLLTEFVEKFGVNVVGGCCGTRPAHIMALAKQVDGRSPLVRAVQRPPELASAVQSVAMQQEPAPFFIGERLNAQGSAKFKKLLLAEDYEGMIQIGRQQIDGGAHGFDVCTALTERSDEIDLMMHLVKRLSNETPMPLIIDSTEPDVIEAALMTAPGRCLINSTNLESGEVKAGKILALAKRYNAAIILLTIDEKGMAKTAARKLEIARRLYHLAVDEYGLKAEDLVFDDLTFTLATGDEEFANSAIETLEGIKQIKQALPGVLTSLGVSNLSFGLAPSARAVLNSVMLYHAVRAGMDMAIVNAAQIKPYLEIPQAERDLAEDLIFNRRADALQRVIQHFELVKTDTSVADSAKAALDAMPPDEKVHWRILHRQKLGIETDLEALFELTPEKSRADRAVEILNNVLLPAMKMVGDKFGAGELILPFVLQSAEVMKQAVAYLENFLERKEGVSKGKLVLATVYGDVHDIGKNLVKTILVNNGFEVVDLGKQVPADVIIQKAVEENADAIGLSALLVSTSKQMPLVVNELHRRGLRIPVLVGGAAINPRFATRILQTENNELYEAGVFYCKDAFEGLAAMNALCDPLQKTAFVEKMQQQAKQDMTTSVTIEKPVSTGSSGAVQRAETIPAAPFFGAKVVQAMPLEIVAKRINEKELYRLNWGAKNARGDEWQKIQTDFKQRLAQMLKTAQQEDWLKPQGCYGYWQAQAEGDALILYAPDADAKKPVEVARLNFSRQQNGEGLCLADYFLPVSSGMMDVVALQVATVGKVATEKFDALQEAGDYAEAFFVHGLAVQVAEAAADYLHDHIRRELGLEDGMGRRYSWGYPALPDLAEHAKVFELLGAEKALGMSLTAAWQLVPEQSTAAIILHHPQTKYFNVDVPRA